MMKLAGAVVLTIATGCQVFGQTSSPTLDSTGNSLLSGTYYFREVIWEPSASYGGALAEAYAFYGQVTFNGSGTYTLSAQLADLQAGRLSTQTASGTYSMGGGVWDHVASFFYRGDHSGHGIERRLHRKRHGDRRRERSVHRRPGPIARA